MAKADHDRTQGAAVLVRMTAEDRSYIEEAVAKKSQQLSAETHGAGGIGIGPFLRGAAFRWAEEILGVPRAKYKPKGAHR